MLSQPFIEQLTPPSIWFWTGQSGFDIAMVGVKHIQRCDQCRQAKRKASFISWSGNKANGVVSVTRLNPAAGDAAISACDAPGLMCVSLYTSRALWLSVPVFVATHCQDQCPSPSRWYQLLKVQACRMISPALGLSSANSPGDYSPVRFWQQPRPQWYKHMDFFIIKMRHFTDRPFPTMEWRYGQCGTHSKIHPRRIQ